ncbi:MAG: Nif3-like dinuclear metal center hexameric protein [Eubacterium sp.]|nr:Nif3-like dinuclear metal center hexameric protein [Eubacterium sp.]
MRKEELIRAIESFCPPDLAEDWDNTGIQIDMGYPEVKRVLTALEITDAVIDEAMNVEADWIVTHHPLIFTSTSSVEYRNNTGRYIQRLIRAGISVYSAHTSFDKAEGGNNDFIGKLLGFSGVMHFDGDDGFLRKADLPEERYFGDMIKDASERLAVDVRLFRAVGDPETKISRVGWCTGSGAEFIQKAFDEGCNLYITGDVKYHDAQLAKGLGMCVLDAGHYGTEKSFADNMAEVLRKKTDAEIIKSTVDINPFSW